MLEKSTLLNGGSSADNALPPGMQQRERDLSLGIYKLKTPTAHHQNDAHCAFNDVCTSRGEVAVASVISHGSLCNSEPQGQPHRDTVAVTGKEFISIPSNLRSRVFPHEFEVFGGVGRRCRSLGSNRWCQNGSCKYVYVIS